MSTIILNIKKNYKIILLMLVVLICLPLMTALIDIIFTYGKYVGSYARVLIEKGVCM